MPRATGKDHARINLDIWGDEDWLDLTPAAQHLYFALWTSPQLSYCGCGEWHPGKIATKARGWTADSVRAAGAELAGQLFLIIDTDTEEFILRSWVKHDGLWRVPNMAVSMANARAELASRTLRGVIVFEVSKLKAREPDSSSWSRDAVVNMLNQRPVDPSNLAPYTWPNGTANPTSNPTSNPLVNPPSNPGSNGYANPSANPTSNPGPTPAPAPAPTSTPKEGGYVNTEGHQSTNDPPPSPYCPKHPGGTPQPCDSCRAARERRKTFDEQRANAAAEARARFLDEIADCPDCDELGWVDTDDGVTRCPKHDWAHAHA